MTERNRIFPTLRCRMGQAIYYATFMSFQDVVDWIKPTDEIHKSQLLSRWIQRQLITKHAAGIADYLLSQKDRFFNAIVVGIYGGDPSWAPLHVSIPRGSQGIALSDEQREHLETSVGILLLSGQEKLFAIDGQHRVAGIKKAVHENSKEFIADEIVALFVGHHTTKAGEQSTRRLFTTLNKTARRVSDADRVALDEDDGFAVVTRRLIDEFDLFKFGKPIAFAPTASLQTNDSEHVTTIISLYSQIKDIYSEGVTTDRLKKSEFGNTRPSNKAIDQVYRFVCEYWQAQNLHFQVVADVFAENASPGDFRKPNKNHLLMRPIGQRAFAGAVGILVERGANVADAIKKLSKIDLWIHKKKWHYILWDPKLQAMLKSPILAETLLLREVGEKGRSSAREVKLNEALKLTAR